MPESYSWDKFNDNVKALAQEQGWLDANTMFALARNASTPDEAVQTAEALRKANQRRMSASMAGFMDNGQLYKAPTLGLQLHRFITSDIGEMPIRENNLVQLQQKLIDQGFATPAMQANGVWGRPWQDAMSQYTRYAYEQRSKGSKPGSWSMGKVFGLMTKLFPTLAYEATIGFAKSFPSDVRHLVADALTGVEVVGGAARLGWNVATGHESFNAALADEVRSTIETKAKLQGVTPQQAAEDWGLINAQRLGLPQPGGLAPVPGQNPNLKYGVALEPGIEDMHFDPWKAVQSNLRDLGTAFMLYSAGKIGANAAGRITAGVSEAGTDIAAARGEAAIQRGPGVIARKVFRRPETFMAVRELPGVAPRVAAAEAERAAYLAAIEDGTAMPRTFSPEGLQRTMAFLNDPLLAETVPVAPGRYGYYAARTWAAKPYSNAAVREVGNLFQEGLKFGVQARVTGNIESAGPGESELLQNIHNTDVLRNFNKNVLGKYGIKTPLGKISPSLDDMMLFVHGPISPGAHTAALGTQTEEWSARMVERANKFFRERSMPQVWDRAMRATGMEGGYDELIGRIAQQLGEIGADPAMAEAYARDFILMKHDNFVRSTFAAREIAAEEAALRESGQFARLTPDDMAQYEPGTDRYHDYLRTKVQDLAGDPARRLEAHQSVMDGFNHQEFINYIVDDAAHHAYAGRGRMASDLNVANDYSGQVGRYVHAVHTMRNEVLPQVVAHFNDVLNDAGLLTQQFSDLETMMHYLQHSGTRLQEDVSNAERTLQGAMLPERNALADQLTAAQDTMARARDAHDGNLARQAAKEERRIQRLTGLLHADRAVIASKSKLLDQAREARIAFEREVTNATIRDSGWQKRAELLGVDVDKLMAEYNALKDTKLAEARAAGRKWTGRDTQKIAQQISRKYLAEDTTLARLQAEEQRAEEALTQAHSRMNDRIQSNRVEYRPRARRENRFVVPSEFTPTPKPDLVQAMADAQQAVEEAQARVQAGPDVANPIYRGPRESLDAAREALTQHEEYRAAVQESLDRLGIRMQLDRAENFDPRNWGIARNDVSTRNTVLGRVEAIRQRYRSLLAEPLPERPVAPDEFDLMSVSAEEAAAMQARYERDLAAYEEAVRTRISGIDPVLNNQINQQIYQLAHDEFGVDMGQMRAAVAGRYRHEAMMDFVRRRQAEVAQLPVNARPTDEQILGEFHTMFTDETERMLSFVEHRAQRLAGDVMLDPRVAPQELIDAEARLNELGYKMVYGRNMGQQLQPHVAPELVSWQKRGRIADTISRLGLKPFIPIANDAVSTSQQAGRLKQYRELLGANADMRRPGLDAMTIDKMITDFNSGVFRNNPDLPSHDPGTSLRRLSAAIADLRSEGVGPNRRWLRSKERQILNDAAMGGDNSGWAAAERSFDQVSAILRATQHRDIDRQSFVRFFMDKKVWASYLPEASKEFARPLTKSQANQLYRAMVRGYTNASVQEAGWSQFDNLVRAATGYVGGNWSEQMRGGALIGGVAGGAYGAIAEDDMGSWARDVALGMGVGALSSRGLGVAADREAAWAVGVQGALANSSNAIRTMMQDLRFSLSPTFSIRRLSKTNYKMGLEGIDPTFRPLHSLEELSLQPFVEQTAREYGVTTKRMGRLLGNDQRLETFIQQHVRTAADADNIVLTSDQVTERANRILENLRLGRDAARVNAIRRGRQLVREAFPEFNTRAMEFTDDAERMLREQDVFQLYNGSSYETYAAYHMGQRGMSTDEIRRKLIHMFQYGNEATVGRSAAERSMNFVFFPWSFDKTLYRNTGVYLLNRPGQMAALVAGIAAYKRFSELYPDVPGASEWVQKHLPILKEVERFNAFGHGLSLGELGGINAPLLQLFIPHQWQTNQDTSKNLARFLPVMKDFQRIKESVMDQNAVLLAAAHNIKAGYVGGSEEMKNLYGTYANPARSTVAPSQQLSEAYRFQAQLYKYFQDDLAYNAGTRDPAKKLVFPYDNATYGKYRGEIIDKKALRSMVADKYPAYDPNAAVAFMTQGQEAIYQYRLNLKEQGRGELSTAIRNFASNAAALSTYMVNAEEGRYPTGFTAEQLNAEFARKTQEMRQWAFQIIDADPTFWQIYRQNYQRVLGPLTKVDRVKENAR